MKRDPAWPAAWPISHGRLGDPVGGSPRRPQGVVSVTSAIGHVDCFNPYGRITLKTSILVAAIVTCALVMPMASAQDQAAPETAAMSTPVGANVSEMHTNITLMQSQMDQIRATTNPGERQKLMQAHMQTMQESMTVMRGMNKSMTTEGGQVTGMAMGADKGKPGGQGMMGGDMMKHHRLMQERMGMIEAIMEQMLQHQQVMESALTK